MNAEKLFASIYVDEDVYSSLAEDLRSRGFDALSTAEAGNIELLDEDQLEFAISKQAAILTFNVKHYTRMHKEYMIEGKNHWGIIVSRQLGYGELLSDRLSITSRFTRS